MKKAFEKIYRLIKLSFISLLAVATIFSCQNKRVAKTETINETTIKEQSSSPTNTSIDENGTYTSKDDVALYIYTYHKLPKNYITKNEAKKLGWNSSKNYVGDVAIGKSIGGDRYGNYEKRLPDIKGRKYIECDIDYGGKKRNAKRIIYAEDFDESIGFIFYTEDHYKTFEKLYWQKSIIKNA